mmetsp:Transcript_1205/g.3031  ORF Transcript_1205/g.3031 Transcript_1205/m.3031 type:complete len:421 (+) Transcript_1205:96-1358(+)
MSRTEGGEAEGPEDRPVKTPVSEIRLDDAGSLVSINQYTIIQGLGKGSFAEVFLCADATTKNEYAVKVFNKSLLRRKRTMERTARGVHVHSELEKVEREIAIMKDLVHPNLVCLFEVIDDDDGDQLYMFMEYVELGPVMVYDKATHTFASRVTGGVCSEPCAAQYLMDVAAGLRFLHQHHIAHRDLKPDNVLLGVNGHVKIADFGVAHFFSGDRNKTIQSVRHLERSSSRAQIMETQGTYCFWAPEMVEVEKSFNAYACDMWATGVCLYIFLTGTLPFFDEAVTTLFDLIRQAQPDIPDDISPDAKRLINGLLINDVTQRLTVHDLESDPWLTDMTANFEAGDDLQAVANSIRNSSVGTESPRSSTKRLRRTLSPADLEAAFSRLGFKCKTVINKVYSMSGSKRKGGRSKGASPRQPADA